MMAGKRRRAYGEGSITRRADGLWVARIEAGTAYTADGAPVRRRLEKTSKEHAVVVAWLATTRADMARFGRTADPTVTVETWALAWLDRKAHHVRPGSMSSYRAVTRTWIIPTIGRKRLAKLTPADVRAVTDAMRAAGRSPRTMHTAHVILGNILEDAVRDGVLTENPQRRVKAPGTFPGSRWAFTEDQTKAVLRAAAAADETRPIAAIYTGMRQSELLGLTWPCVDLAAGQIRVEWQLRDVTYSHGCGHQTGKVWPCGKRRGMDCPRGNLPMPDGLPARHLVGAWWLLPPKSGKTRTVPIDPFLAAVLRRQLAADDGPNPHGLVWHRDDGQPIRPREDEVTWRTVVTAAGLPAEATLHFARHTAASLLLEEGVDTKVAGEILGHAHLDTTAGYQHVSSDLAKAGIAKLGQRLALD